MSAPAADIAGFADAAAMLSAFRDGHTSVVSVVEALLERHGQNRNLGAFCAVDEAAVRRAAAEADAKLAQGVRMPLLGLPLCIKDNIDVLGLPTTAGTPALEGFYPARTAPVAQRLLDQGALVFGKTAMHELAFGTSGNNAWQGAAHNPFDLDRIPGGSSSGTAAAIAAGLVPAGLGSDTGGSVRIPAAFCGLAGLRPTIGRYPGEGVFPISFTRDTVGPLARNFTDLALLDAVITGADTTLEAIEPSAVRLGVPDAFFFDGLQQDVAKASEQALAALSRAGVSLVPVSGARFGELYRRAGVTVTLHETRPAITAHLRASGLSISYDDVVAKVASPDVMSILADLDARAEAPFLAAYRQAMDIDRPALQALYAETVIGARLDGIVFPTTKLAALRIGQDVVDLGEGQVPAFDLMIENSGPGSLSGMPGITVPCGVDGACVPLGLSVDGLFHTDRRLLALGTMLERLLPKPWNRGE
ncbi:MAG: indoleacetamide hydrolase [Mesorhizobium sp.]